MYLENNNLESNTEDVAPPMHRCDWSSEVIATEKDMELQNANQESNNDDSAPKVHLCDLPDEIIIIISHYVFSLGVFNIGAVRYALNRDCLSLMAH